MLAARTKSLEVHIKEQSAPQCGARFSTAREVLIQPVLHFLAQPALGTLVTKTKLLEAHKNGRSAQHLRTHISTAGEALIQFQHSLHMGCLPRGLSAPGGA
ncbi:hypothetical protein NDU88_002506 [Pleurodeles waltl]|uniref:Uncharacterized protein n=1 Tax=Pleurodeles waltl TaxID=8319 RepID=A0AAV7U9H7_PLEWA|nr:hypothetical protein NDU88_002506 [Pleurodeles waltl]